MLHYSRRSYFVATGLAIALALGGCATDDYRHYAEAQMAMAQAKSTADQARYSALARIAETGDSAARVAAVMSLAGIGDGARQAPANVAAPVSPGGTALQWASVLVPGLTQAYMISSNVKLGMRQSDNATALGLGQSRDQAATSAATMGAFASVAGQIQSPAATVNTSTVTLTGAGVIGGGSYEVGPNSGAQSGNSGRLAGGSITDNTSTPTVVVQPAPTVVRPEVVRPEVVRPEAVAAPEATQP